MKVREEKRGDALLRIIARGKGYAGAVIMDGKASTVVEGDDLQALWAQLETMAAKANPEFFGYSGARARFMRIFPGGFEDQKFRTWERDYKMKAKRKLDAALPLEAALMWSGSGDGARSAFGATNLLAPIEMARVGEALRSTMAGAFICGAAAFANGAIEAGLRDMVAVLKPFGITKWTVLTYLPYLWRPEAHMFLKPEVTREYAERVGHSFKFAYAPEPTPAVYASLLDLAQTTRREIADLRPADMIDVQSFIWTVGKYTAKDVDKVHAQAAERVAPID